MRTIQKYIKEEGPRAAASFLRHLANRDNLSKIPDPSATRRKEPPFTSDELTLFEFAVESFREKEMRRNSYTEIMLQDAFRRSDKRTFEIVAMACEYAATSYQTKHGKNVICAMECAARIMEDQNRLPTKYEVKKAVNDKIESAAFAIADSQSWTKVLRDARLGDLPTKLPKRGPTGQGNR